jgi:2-oxoglutarate ferredoxin oxidoreductase subunit alpha
VKNAIADAEKEGVKIGLIRPISVWPFPTDEIKRHLDGPKAFLSVEMNAGQMVEDVRLAVNGAKPVHFYGRTGGMAPTQAEIVEKAKRILGT